MAYQRKTSPKTDAERREALLLMLRQVSREAAERFPRVARRVGKLNAFMARRLRELQEKLPE